MMEGWLWLRWFSVDEKTGGMLDCPVKLHSTQEVCLASSSEALPGCYLTSGKRIQVC